MWPSAPRSRPALRPGPGSFARVGGALLLLVCGAWLLPGSVFADTGSPPPFVPPVEDPGGDALRTLTSVGAIVITVVAVIGGIALAGAVVARLGRSAAAEPSRQGSVRPGSTIGWVAFGIVLLAAAVIGIVAGRGMAYFSSVGGFASITAAFFGLALGVAVVVLVIVAAIARARRKAMSPAIVSLLLAAGVLPVGALVGAGTAAMSGGTYRDPVYLEAAGTASIELTTPDLEFTPTPQGSATCGSVADGTDVAGVVALDLGELKVGGVSGTLRGEVGVATGDADATRLSLWIDGGDLVEESFQPFWDGSGALGQVSQDGKTGTVPFSELRIMEKPDPSMPSLDWPATLSGSIEWSCGDW